MGPLAMAMNPFDQASRYAAKLDPAGFLAWLLGAAVVFVRWLDTRRLPTDVPALQHLVRQLVEEVRRLRQDNEQSEHRLDQALPSPEG